MSSSSPLENSKTILLFGKTGDGKSTLGNMLISREVKGEFASGNSMEAVTQSTQAGVNNENGMTVVDTVGLFSNVNPKADFQNAIELNKHLANKYHKIDVFCYVKKATKFTRADEACLKVFSYFFGKQHPSNVLLIFTSCKGDWLKENDALITRLMGSKFVHRVGVDFPPYDDDEEVETVLKDRREESMRRLTDALNSVFNRAGPAYLKAERDTSSTRSSELELLWKGLKKLLNLDRSK